MTESKNIPVLNEINALTPLEDLQLYAQARIQEGVSGETVLDELRSRGISVSRGIAAIKKEKSPEKLAAWFYPKLMLAWVLILITAIGVTIAFLNDTGDPRKLARTLFYLIIPAVAGVIMLVDLISQRSRTNISEGEESDRFE